MIKVITYGTYDMLHHGHIRLLERAKALGNYLIVGVTSDDFDRIRGKINVKQSLMERVEAVRNTELADEIIIEEYEGQKIDDIKRYNIDIFTVGSDWIGVFDYLNEYCKVVYLDRTQGISSTELRSQEHHLRLGLVGSVSFLSKFLKESKYVNGIKICAAYNEDISVIPEDLNSLDTVTDDYSVFLDEVDAIYVISPPQFHYKQIKLAIEKGKHILCESPVAIKPEMYEELKELAQNRGVILMSALRVAFSMAYSRLLLLLKGGKIGEVKSVDAVCTSLRSIDTNNKDLVAKSWNSFLGWGPTAMLPIFQILGTNYKNKIIASHFADEDKLYDNFTKVSFVYPNSVASLKVGNGVKSEGELIISGTKGYVYVPAPWWKMDYFEVRYENPENNKRYFYQLDGEGIRYELLNFLKSIANRKATDYISNDVSLAISKLVDDFNNKIDLIEI